MLLGKCACVPRGGGNRCDDTLLHITYINPMDKNLLHVVCAVLRVVNFLPAVGQLCKRKQCFIVQIGSEHARTRTHARREQKKGNKGEEERARRLADSRQPQPREKKIGYNESSGTFLWFHKQADVRHALVNTSCRGREKGAPHARGSSGVASQKRQTGRFVLSACKKEIH